MRKWPVKTVVAAKIFLVGCQIDVIGCCKRVHPIRPRRTLETLAHDDALQALAVIDARRSRVVELRFFGGLSVEETAEVLNVSPETAMHDWKLAKVWLLREMSGEKRDEA